MAFPWQPVKTYEDIRYEVYDGIAKITINRPEVRNAFRPKTVMEMMDAFAHARDDRYIGVVILTGEGDRGLLLRRRPEGAGRRRLRRRATGSPG